MSLELYISTNVSNPEKATSLLNGQQTTLDEFINLLPTDSASLTSFPPLLYSTLRS